ncbi:SPOR domain-containing protein [Bosea sp. TND4EK4]|uniref:SPOR domain-containing protein n=1 Tax=Bosea sp. TND4EK4 TaxID=1907408 RepID=UPI000956E183|nr:SPOR domain-containing protein [Bosea sp. TND4EK4]SIQ72408.1 Cell division protein DedD (protein involved in septation) [Bosea sp. TND4EK4]
MSEPARNRFALDLEDLERQLRSAGQAPRPGQQSDPLAELTRIVGQDDPLKDIFSERRAPAPQPARQEPGFSVVPPRAPAAAPTMPPAEMRGALDEFEALLRRTEPRRPVEAPAQAQGHYEAEPEQRHEDAGAYDDYRQTASQPAGYGRPAPPTPDMLHQARDLDDGQSYYQQPVYAEARSGHGYEPGQAGEEGYAEDELPELEPRRSRKGLWAAAAVIAVGVLGVGGWMALRGGSSTTNGAPPVITADKGPVKVEPTNPGGTEIPNQNKQIYERTAEQPQGQTKVVSNEEQPVDVQQAARSLPPRVVMPGPGTAGTALAAAPAAPERSIVQPEPALTPMPAVPGLGEPRKVRTVAIRPDGTPAPAANAAPLPSQPLATGSTGQRGLATLPNATANAAPAAPRSAPATTPSAATTPAAPTRLASAPPAQAPAAPAARAGTGDFVVQLAAPGSEAEARATFAALQKKYGSVLGGTSPIVRKTDLAGGKTVYRLRVGPYSREDATSMCTQLQAAGGQCFIAKN